MKHLTVEHANRCLNRAIFIAVIILCIGALAGCSSYPEASASEMTTAGPIIVNAGAVNYCKAHPKYCGRSTRTDKLELTPERWRVLNQVNERVNASMRHVDDGEFDQWSHDDKPTGDCEDFALRKRRELIDAGWPAHVLLIATAKIWTGEGHAVIVVVTDRGDYIMDNLQRYVVHWEDVSYEWIRKQSPRDGTRWEAVR